MLSPNLASRPQERARAVLLAQASPKQRRKQVLPRMMNTIRRHSMPMRAFQRSKNRSRLSYLNQIPLKNQTNRLRCQTLRRNARYRLLSSNQSCAARHSFVHSSSMIPWCATTRRGVCFATGAAGGSNWVKLGLCPSGIDIVSGQHTLGLRTWAILSLRPITRLTALQGKISPAGARGATKSSQSRGRKGRGRPRSRPGPGSRPRPGGGS